MRFEIQTFALRKRELRDSYTNSDDPTRVPLFGSHCFQNGLKQRRILNFYSCLHKSMVETIIMKSWFMEGELRWNQIITKRQDEELRGMRD